MNLRERLAVLGEGDPLRAIYTTYVVFRGDDHERAAQLLGTSLNELRSRVRTGLRSLRAMGRMDLVADLMAA